MGRTSEPMNTHAAVRAAIGRHITPDERRRLAEGDPEDETGLRESARRIDGAIDAQIAAGIDAQRIVLAGFSQGGAVALHCALRHAQPLGGLIALSTYLPLHSRVAAERHAANQTLAVFLAHGLYDPVGRVWYLRYRQSF